MGPRERAWSAWVFMGIGAPILATNYFASWKPGDTLPSFPAIVLLTSGWFSWALARHGLGRYRKLAGALRTLLTAVGAVAVTHLLVGTAAFVPSASMAPVLEPGDFIIVEKLSYGFVLPYGKNWVIGGWTDPERGDVVLARSPQDRNNLVIKRVVGLPGDVVAVRNGHAVINNDPTVDRWGRFDIPSKTAGPRINRDVPALRLPPGSYFLLGDNRLDSIDSRYWGPVPRHAILGRVVLIYFSWADGRPRWERIGFPR